MHDINQITDYFIKKSCENGGEGISQTKLQKLLYLSYGWYLTLHDQELFEDCPESWQYGPVFKKIYQRFKGKGNQPITGEDMLTICDGIEREVQDFLDDIWDEYGQYTTEKLANITHDDPVWLQVQKQGYRQPLVKDTVVGYFKYQQEKAQENQDLLDIYEIENRNLQQGLSVGESKEFLKSISL